jgi:glucose dehydrogenase
VDWTEFGFNGAHRNFNPLETVLSTTSVLNLSSPWTKTTIFSNDGSSPSDANGDVFQECSGALCAYSQVTGALVWRSPQTQDLGTPAIGDGVVIESEGYCYISGAECQYIHAYNQSTGAAVWSRKIPASSDQAPVLVGSTLYVATDTEFYALAASTGKVLWSLAGSFWTSPAYVSGYLVMGSYEGLEAVSPTSHKLLWNVTTPTSVSYPPLIGAGGVVYTDGTGKAGVTAFNITNGAVLWSNSQWVTGPMAIDQTTLLVPTEGGLVADQTSNGQVAWTAPVAAQVTGSPVAANGVVYYATGTTMIAANLADGTTLWNDSTLASPVQGTPIVVNGRLYAATADGALHAWVP